MKYKVIVNCNLEYTFDVDSREEAIIGVENVELPPEYVEDSFKIVKVKKDKNLVYCENCQKMTPTKLHKDKYGNDYMTCVICKETK